MLQEALALVLQLPPAAFGPTLPPPAFVPPRELSCEVRDLGRIQVPPPPSWSLPGPAGAPIRAYLPGDDRRVVHPLLAFPMVWTALAATKGAWDERGWAAKRWDALGAVAPVLIPPRYGPTPALRP